MTNYQIIMNLLDKAHDAAKQLAPFFKKCDHHWSHLPLIPNEDDVYGMILQLIHNMETCLKERPNDQYHMTACGGIVVEVIHWPHASKPDVYIKYVAETVIA